MVPYLVPGNEGDTEVSTVLSLHPSWESESVESFIAVCTVDSPAMQHPIREKKNIAR